MAIGDFMTRKILAGLLAVFLTLGMVSQAFAQDLPYYFQIEAFNENGIGKRTQTVEVAPQ